MSNDNIFKVTSDMLDGDGTFGKFVCKPLDRGYGITLGNSLRRILLSSLEGVAITSIKIDGILHEFTTIPGRTVRCFGNHFELKTGSNEIP